MGNDGSQFSKIEIDEETLQTSKYWSLHTAINQNASVFIDRNLSLNFSTESRIVLLKYAKNLMVFRHPCILKYIYSLTKKSGYYLIVEDIIPLAVFLETQNSLQKCIGLYSILKAICFLHEKGKVSHNNISINSIYINKDGDWKLGGMEFCCLFDELTESYLQKNISNDVNPKVVESLKLDKKDCVDFYAFAALTAEILKDEEDVNCLQFLEFCETILLNEKTTETPKLFTLLQHPFFHNDFVSIYLSLQELPIMAVDEKKSFFSTLHEKLKQFDETLVAKQLGSLLLSRLVLLDETAQNKLLPLILHPRNDTSDELFSVETFRQYIIPKLLKVFSVRDVQIRLIFLEHFTHFISCFTADELQHQILPELLVGVKDVNNELVSTTLKTLGDLVKILGAEVVIGGKRAKLFNDGKPNTIQTNVRIDDLKIFPDVPLVDNEVSVNFINSTVEENCNLVNLLPERQRPDGQENGLSIEPLLQVSQNDDLNNWDDWNISSQLLESEGENIHNSITIRNNIEPKKIDVKTEIKKVNRNIPDISQLDIKNQTDNFTSGNMNFFEGMEPEIKVQNTLVLPNSEQQIDRNKLDLSAKISDNDVGWDEDWGTD